MIENYISVAPSYLQNADFKETSELQGGIAPPRSTEAAACVTSTKTFMDLVPALPEVGPAYMVSAVPPLGALRDLSSKRD